MAEPTPVGLIGPSTALVNSRPGLRFTLADGRPAFAIRYRNRVYAYLNACAHVPVELDLVEGDLFDLSGQYLVCAMHGAYYHPESGVCLGGPCPGRRLTSIAIEEHDGQLWLAGTYTGTTPP